MLFSIQSANRIVRLSLFAFGCCDSNITSRATSPNWIVLTSNVDALHSHSIDVIVAPDKKVPVRANGLRPDKRRDKSEISRFSLMSFISENSFHQFSSYSSPTLLTEMGLRLLYATFVLLLLEAVQELNP